MLTAAETTAFNRAFADRIATEGGSDVSAGADPKKIFCEYWNYCKMALEAIAALVPNIIVKGAVKTIIAAGDVLHGQICK